MVNSCVSLSIMLLIICAMFIGSSMSHDIDTRVYSYDNGVVINGLFEQYVLIKRPKSRIAIRCSKSANRVNGFIYAFVNDVKIAEADSVCLRYYNDVKNENENLCINKLFLFDLTLVSEDISYYDVRCQVNDGDFVDKNSDILKRLYEDDMPRIRKVMTVYSPMSIPQHDIRLDVVSCEIVADSNDPIDGLQWYRSDLLDVNFNLPFKTIRITESLVNYTSTFKLTPDNIMLYTPSNFYRCCTTRLGKPSKCSGVFFTGSIDELTTSTAVTSVTSTVSSQTSTVKPQTQTSTLVSSVNPNPQTKTTKVTTRPIYTSAADKTRNINFNFQILTLFSIIFHSLIF